MNARDILKIALNLLAVYVVGGLILAFVYAKTSPIIYRNHMQEREEALKEMMPRADEIVKLGDWTIHGKHGEYFAARKAGETEGYIIQSFGKGYTTFIDTLVAVDPQLTVQRISILGHAETPGLGDEIESDSFRDQFRGKELEQLKVVKYESDEYIEAISGATISSRAVAEDAAANAVAFLKKTLQGEGSRDAGK
jgi:Na+-translocating ferredoxin:NAD+ oxidoreductase subunit G